MGEIPPLVYNLEVFPVQEVTGAWLSWQHHGGHVPDDFLLLTVWHGSEPLLQTQFPLATEEQQEAHLTNGIPPGQNGNHDAWTNTDTHKFIINYPVTHTLWFKPLVCYFHCSLKSNATEQTSLKGGWQAEMWRPTHGWGQGSLEFLFQSLREHRIWVLYVSKHWKYQIRNWFPPAPLSEPYWHTISFKFSSLCCCKTSYKDERIVFLWSLFSSGLSCRLTFACLDFVPRKSVRWKNPFKTSQTHNSKLVFSNNALFKCPRS